MALTEEDVDRIAHLPTTVPLELKDVIKNLAFLEERSRITGQLRDHYGPMKARILLTCCGAETGREMTLEDVAIELADPPS